MRIVKEKAVCKARGGEGKGEDFRKESSPPSHDSNVNKLEEKKILARRDSREGRQGPSFSSILPQRLQARPMPAGLWLCMVQNAASNNHQQNGRGGTFLSALWTPPAGLLDPRFMQNRDGRAAKRRRKQPVFNARSNPFHRLDSRAVHRAPFRDGRRGRRTSGRTPGNCLPLALGHTSWRSPW